jgi:hypothetical protein
MTDRPGELACQRLKQLLDLAAQARGEGRGDDVVRYLQEALAAAEPLVHGIVAARDG